MPKTQFNIVVIGSGNMAWAMTQLFLKQHTIVQIVSRNPKTGRALANKAKCTFTARLDDVYTNADFYLLAVPDDVIVSVSKKLKHVNGILIHHSGATPLNAIPYKGKRAVLYPFLSVQKNTLLNKKNTPIFTTSDTKSTAFLIQTLLSGCKFNANEVDDENRIRLHLAAVLVHNFTNHLYYQAGKLTKNIAGSKALLNQLAHQALDNFSHDSTFLKQTGPARRKDIATQKKHLQLLKSNSDLANIYLYLSISITNTYKHE